MEFILKEFSTLGDTLFAVHSHPHLSPFSLRQRKSLNILGARGQLEKTGSLDETFHLEVFLMAADAGFHTPRHNTFIPTADDR